MDLTGRSGENSASFEGWRARRVARRCARLPCRVPHLLLEAKPSCHLTTEGRDLAAHLGANRRRPGYRGYCGTGGGETGGTATGGDAGPLEAALTKPGALLQHHGSGGSRAARGVYQTILWTQPRRTSCRGGTWRGRKTAVILLSGIRSAIRDRDLRRVVEAGGVRQPRRPGSYRRGARTMERAADALLHGGELRKPPRDVLCEPLGDDGWEPRIANVELEVVPELIGGPTDYESTDNNRWVFDADCRFDPDWNLRDAFARVCEGGHDYGNTVPVCWWELKTRSYSTSNSLRPDMARWSETWRGNYNERHLSTALNIRDGVIDCSTDPSPDCYGEAYVEYDLVHSASNIPIVGYNPMTCSASTSRSAIRSGKALAAERTSRSRWARRIANCYRSGLHQVRAGRQAALWDLSPANQGHSATRLGPGGDIQLVMNYRAWSRVARPDAN